MLLIIKKPTGLPWVEEKDKKKAGLTVVAVHAGEGGHGAVAGVVLPLLDADTHVGAGVLLTRGARTCGGRAQGL